MPKDAFWGNIFKNPLKPRNLKILEHIPIFEQFRYFELLKFSRILHERTFAKNEIIFREEDLGESMYIVKSGKVKIFTRLAGGKEREFSVLDEGHFFGEVSLVDKAPRSASAIALEKTDVLVLFRGDLMTLIDRNPRLAAFFLLHLSMIISQRLRASNRELNKYKLDGE
jgi:CRP-like cAMP-binding protein